MRSSEPEPVVCGTDPAVFNDVRTAPSPGEKQEGTDARS